MVPGNALVMAYIDPYNLEYLSFDILQELGKLRVDLAINFSTMDLIRNADFELDPTRARFDKTAPGWRAIPGIGGVSKANIPSLFFDYWCGLVKSLGFDHCEQMPIITNRSKRVVLAH
jgi:three-Cys-motif partner protein